jgi:1-acyl-sn-glycerol-3-phosphate acyltransferase
MTLAINDTDNQTSADWGPTSLAVARFFGFIAICVALIPTYALTRSFWPHKCPKLTVGFYKALLRVIGFHVRVHGHMCPNIPTLFVSNHSSYLDIPVLGGIIPAYFVAKSDVAEWPLFGFLSRLQRTVFVERQVMRTGEQADTMRSRLAEKHSLILFPEGTSSDGMGVYPFKSSFFAVAEDISKDIALTVQPVSVTCTELEGMPVTRSLRPIYAWYGDMTMVGHLWKVFCVGRLTVDVIFHAAVKPGDFSNRKMLAAYCQDQVSRGVEQCITGRFTDANQPLLENLKVKAS